MWSPQAADARSRCPAVDAPAHSISLHKLRRSISCLVEHKRVDHGLRRFAANRKLRDSARHHNSYMLALNCFSHQCQGEPVLATRIGATGYLDGATSYSVGEDLGYAASSGAMIRSWMHDPLHRANILSASFEDFGVSAAWDCPHDPAYAACAGDHDATYTINFGRRRS